MDDEPCRESLDDEDLPPLVMSFAADEIALAALSQAPTPEVRCHACDEPIAGEPAGHGLFLWARGDEVQLEEPPLCTRCATAIGVSAQRVFEVEEEEG
jgi:hypothetical protein